MQLNSINANIGTTYTGIVTGAELESVSKEIFGLASGESLKVAKKTSATEQQPVQTTNEQINLYNRKTNLDLTRQIAQNNAGYNLQLSQSTIQNIQALKAFAVSTQQQIHKVVEGKVIVPNSEDKQNDVLDTFAVGHTTTVSKLFALEKENPFLSDDGSTSAGLAQGSTINNFV